VPKSFSQTSFALDFLLLTPSTFEVPIVWMDFKSDRRLQRANNQRKNHYFSLNLFSKPQKR
jgi:hypothetical protein